MPQHFVWRIKLHFIHLKSIHLFNDNELGLWKIMPHNFKPLCSLINQSCSWIFNVYHFHFLGTLWHGNKYQTQSTPVELVFLRKSSDIKILNRIFYDLIDIYEKNILFPNLGRLFLNFNSNSTLTQITKRFFNFSSTCRVSWPR